MSKTEHSSIISDSTAIRASFADMLLSLKPLEGNHHTRLTGRRIAFHTIYWLAIVVLSAYHGSLFGGDFSDNLLNTTALLPAQLLATYSFVYFIYPHLILKKKWLIVIALGLMIILLTTTLARLSVIYLAEPFFRSGSERESLWQIISDPLYLFQVYTISIILPVLGLFLIKMTKDRFNQLNQYEKLQREKKSMELEFLKAQMNPHFLFNTLNNIYALASQGSSKSADMIMKLSEIMSYTLYDCNADRVSLIDEWKLIENYIDLELMRVNKEVRLVLNSEVEQWNQAIAPLVLISIVENAFKHGLGAQSPFIHINLSVINNTLCFEVENSMISVTPVKNKTSRSKIGVGNVRRQLELQYPSSHSLIHTKQNDKYHVKLTIKL